jgi:demethylmenaquinone methyltransferase/2-methoxy-6-polyprenyl-1,4-benzoquinol methylase
VNSSSSYLDKSAPRVRAMFSDIAGSYDFLNHLLSGNQDARWRRRAAHLLGVRRGQRVLDLCCGTGDLSFAILKQQPCCEIVSADFALPMLQRAQKKNSKFKIQSSKFVNADALHLPFANASFDAAAVAFGARNFENTQTGLRELYRVLRPGGKLLILEFMRPPSKLLQKGFGAFNLVLSPIGRAVSGHPTAYSYLPQSVDGFYTRAEFADLLRAVGFCDVRKWEHSAGVATSFLSRKN